MQTEKIEQTGSPKSTLPTLADQWQLPYIDTIKPSQLKPELLKALPIDFLRRQRLLPIADEAGNCLIAVADPLDLDSYDAVMNMLGGYHERILCPPGQIEQAISRCYYHSSHKDQPHPTHPAEPTGAYSGTLAPREDLLDTANQPPVVKLVNTILFQAVTHRASDIHVEPYHDKVTVRFRIDGVLHDAFTPHAHQAAALISRLKVMANLDIAERRLPQDGQSRIKIGQNELDIRVSIVPTAGGERVVLRLLDKQHDAWSLPKLGFEPQVARQFEHLIDSPCGIILLTGPTGSGKTTTLYCTVNQLNDHQRNILTVEDPIEYQLPGIGQMQVKPKINLTFSNCLRHILRQDPDIIMIGEIRDRETAQIATHASLTGHLVLSTLHTNDSPSAVTRLVDMGIEPYLISSSLRAVMAQRLVRTICPHCKVACKTERDLSALLEHDPNPSPVPPQLYTGAGCSHCFQTGYLGRTGLFELLTIDPDIAELITANTSTRLIAQAAIDKGMRTLRQDGLRQVTAGLTTIEEVLRVTQEDNPPENKVIEHVGTQLQS